MQRYSYFDILKLGCVLCFTAIIFSLNAGGKTFKRQSSVPDKILYTYIFHRFTEMNRQADNLSDEREKVFLRNYFKEMLGLSDEQNQIFQTISANFKTGFDAVSKKQKFKLALLYRDELKRLFGDEEFARFNKNVRNNFAKEIIYISVGPTDIIGSASIALNTATHTLYGNAGTAISDNLTNNSLTTCSVSATMSGPNVSKSGSASGDCSVSNVAIPQLSDTGYSDNSQYCIVANFTGVDRNSTVTQCLTTPPANRVTSVTYEQILTDDLPIDNNPNAGGGLRIYPDKKIPAETADRRKIRVKAQYSQAVAGVRIYFRNLDIDDPSANSAPIDNETTANAGNDNNGNVDGTPATKSGLLSIPQGATGCQTFANGISCLTGANGMATVDFTLTKQPGDNFTVVAGNNETYVNNLTLSSDGINLKDPTNTQIPATKTSLNLNECLASAVTACRADMLTIWRRLHIEIDSLGNIGTSNNVTGTITNVRQVPNPNCNPLPPNNPPPNPPCAPTETVYDVNTSLEPNRFENGRIVIGLRSFKVARNSDLTITLSGNPSGSRRNIQNSIFTLYDDDDYNNDDNRQDGDNSENLVKPEISFYHLLDEDGNHLEDGTPKNIFASAYIKPVQNWASQFNNIVPFDLNVDDNEAGSTASGSLMNANRGSKNFESDNFWIVYLIFGYQPQIEKDFDSMLENISFAKTPRISACDCYLSSNCPRNLRICNTFPIGGMGSIVFLETGRDYRKTWLNPPSPYSPKEFNHAETTVPHEIGHQLGLYGDEYSTLFKIMDYQDPINTSGNVEVSFHPEHINILRKRVKSPGEI